MGIYRVMCIPMFSSTVLYVFIPQKQKNDLWIAMFRVYMYHDHSSVYQFNDIPKEVQDHMIEIGDVMFTCGGITVENPEFQKCIKEMDSYDRVEYQMVVNDQIMGIPLMMVQEGINQVCSFRIC